MNYQTYPSSADLNAVVKCHWTLEVPAEMSGTKQRILPDGCVDMVFILGDDIRRVLPDGGHVNQPRAMILGQITEAFDVEPTGTVDSFAVRFYPFGFSSFFTKPLKELANRETPLDQVFGQADAANLERGIVNAADTAERIRIAEDFLRSKLKASTVIDQVIKETVGILLSTQGSATIDSLVKGDRSNRRKLERSFNTKIGVSPKQLAKVIRLQTALRSMLEPGGDNLTRVAYESEYYDQAHFNNDFREFTGMSPRDFLGSEMMSLSTLLYAKD